MCINNVETPSMGFIHHSDDTLDVNDHAHVLSNTRNVELKHLSALIPHDNILRYYQPQMSPIAVYRLDVILQRRL